MANSQNMTKELFLRLAPTAQRRSTLADRIFRELRRSGENRAGNSISDKSQATRKH